MGALGGQSDDAKKKRKELFAAGGLEDDDKIKLLQDIEATIKASIDSHLAASLAAEWSSRRAGTRAFEFEADLGALTPTGTGALEKAFRGDLSEIPEDRQVAADMGIALQRRLQASTRSSGQVLQVNLLGIFNFRSIEEMTLSSVAVHNEHDGSLTITDEATAKRVATRRLNIFVADDRKLRGALAEHFFVTAIYRGSKLAVGAPELKSRHVYFEHDIDTNAETMKDNLEVAEALKLMKPDEKSVFLADSTDFGESTLTACVNYGDDDFRLLFVGPDNTPISRSAYEDVGRSALGLLVREGDSRNDYRRLITDNDAWARMKPGPAQFGNVFRNSGLDPTQLLILGSDYTAIVWWAKAMAKASKAIVEIEVSFADSEPAENDEGFQQGRARLADLLAEVARTTEERFGDPWGLVAMAMAGRYTADASVTIQWKDREDRGDTWSGQRGDGCAPPVE